MRSFTDFWVRGEDFDQAIELLTTLKKLGFHGAVMELKPSLNECFDELESEAEKLNLNLHRKLIIESETRGDLLKTLRENRGKFEVITVLCRNLEVALVAARDSRVDTLIIPPHPGFRIDKGVASLIRNAVELPFSYFLQDRQAFFKTALEIVSILGRKVNLIISSGASDPLSLRGPRELVSLLQVLGYDQEKALDSVSKIPEEIVKENLLKLSKRYVARGVVKLD